MSAGRLSYYSTLILIGLVGVSLVFAAINPFQLGPFFYSWTSFANISGFAALILISATGVLMLFRKGILRRTKDASLLKGIHLALAAIGGVFLVVHVLFFLLFPLTLPVLFGYVATYAAFAIWVTGITLMEGLRTSHFYHGLLSLAGVSLMVLHVFGAGRTFSVFFSGVALVVIAAAVLIAAAVQLAKLSNQRPPAV